jgi:MoxR-like ATPase
MSTKLNEILERIDRLEEFDSPDITRNISKLTEADLFYLRDNPEKYSPCMKRICAAEETNVLGHLSSLFANKEELVELLLACTIAEVPMVLLGPPGTAKSALVRTFCETLGLRPQHADIKDFETKLRKKLEEAKEKAKGEDKKAKPEGANGSTFLEDGRNDTSGNKVDPLHLGDRPLFEYLVTRYTTPEEILGPANIDAMLNLSLFYREGEGMLPSAQIAFLDEIFKANSAILNALLSIINERIYYNAGRAFDVNLVTIFGASNESPDTEELAALYDRFPIRGVSDPVPDNSVDDLLKNSEQMSHENESKISDNGQGLEKQKGKKRIACVNDFRVLSRISYVLYGDNGKVFGRQENLTPRTREFAEEFKNMFLSLRDEFGISDRTPERLLRVAKALALLNGDNELGPDYLRVFRYCAPNTDSARILRNIVDERIAGVKESV